jgi:putative ABC transport system permease protein
MANERLMAVVVSTFAICAAFAAIAGIYGLMAYLATLRRREIAIRMALGATGVKMVRLMTAETLVVVLAGIVIGLIASRALAPVLQPMLYGTVATSPSMALATATVVLVATVMATAGPIGRATRLAPAQVLRE